MRIILILSSFAILTACGTKKKEETTTDCFTADVKPIIDSKCAECHTASHGSKFYENKTNFLASRAKTYVSATSGIVMPPANKTQLTAAEKTTFANCN